MEAIGLWAPPVLRAALAARFPDLRPLSAVEELKACSCAFPLLLAGEGICPSGWLLAAFLRAEDPTRPLALLESRCTPLSIWVAGEIGLNAILDLTRTPEEWAEALACLARGQIAWPSDLLDQAADFERGLGRRLRRLSPRDWARWRDLAAGLPPKALAARWGLSPAGVSRYLRRLADRLGVAGPMDLLCLGLAIGIWVGPPGAPRLALPLQAWRLLRAAGDPPAVKNWNTHMSKK